MASFKGNILGEGAPSSSCPFPLPSDCAVAHIFSGGPPRWPLQSIDPNTIGQLFGALEAPAPIPLPPTLFLLLSTLILFRSLRS